MPLAAAGGARGAEKPAHWPALPAASSFIVYLPVHYLLATLAFLILEYRKAVPS